MDIQNFTLKFCSKILFDQRSFRSRSLFGILEDGISELRLCILELMNAADGKFAMATNLIATKCNVARRPLTCPLCI